MKKKNTTNKSRLRTNRVFKRIVAFSLATTMVFNIVPFEEMIPVLKDITTISAHAVTPRKKAVSYNSMEEFATYSIEYSASPELYSEDIITLHLNTGVMNSFPSNYIPLGTEEAPFNGKIYINTTFGNSWWFETEKPIFDYITDSAVVNYSSEEHINDPIEIELRRKENSAISPLWANHVTSGGTSKATWKIKSAVQTQATGDGENILVCNYSGLIGEMDENAEVTIEYDNSSNRMSSGNEMKSNVQSEGNVGLICGTMREGSKITISLSGTNNGCHITSTDEGHAGGLVGEMERASELVLKTSYEPSASRIITANNGYAGGLVGYNNGGKVTFSDEADADECTVINGTIIGTTGAGGIYGYYSNYCTVTNNGNDPSIEVVTPEDITVDMKNFDIDCTVNAESAGGLIGVLNTTADFTVDGSDPDANEITVAGDTVTYFGGLVGSYQTSALTNSFEVNDVTVSTSATLTGDSRYGGICGIINGNSAAYVKADNFTHKSSSGFDEAGTFGGAIGDAGRKGSILDIGSATIETGVGTGNAANGSAYKGGGIVGVLTDGVLRLSGTTDLTKAPATPATPKTDAAAEYKESGQLVGIRTNSLVYAVGNGNSGDWVFNRSTTQVNADDIGTWGSVIRIGGVESDVLTFDSTNHTVTVKAPVTTISSVAEYTKTALNMQLNDGDKGALKFADSINTKSVLLNTNLTISGTINLSGTGNIGLMRDDYKDNLDEIGAYTKTVSGGTVNLAIGERYGSPSVNVGRGDIIAHRYNGLIARTDTGAEVSGITIDGTINVNATIDGTHIGGAVSDAKKGITLTNVTAQETINFNKISGANHVVGGMVADVTGGNTSISDSTVKPEITLTGDINNIPIGGAIGNILNSNTAITASSVTVAANINASGGATATGDPKNVSCAGFISDISGGTMSLTGVTVNGTTITNSAIGSQIHAGGFLGMKWLGTNVSFTENNGVILSGTNTLSTNAQYAAGLVQYATGHWTVPEKGINITGMSITGATNSLGLIVHDGYSGSNGLYLELTHKDSYYLGAGLTIPAAANYDELVRSTGSDILSNGSKGIISITTDGDLLMDGANCNTYQNKYNQNNLTNNKSRYYYNLTKITAKTNKSDGEKLLLWSLNKYAATNINSFFPDSFGSGSITGTFDMNYISYYPIDCPNDLKIGNATFIFYNNEIEASEAGTGNSDNGVRTTRSASQHYLMHSGVFRNVSKSVTTSGNIHFKGSIGVDSTYSGALINGILSGSLTTDANKEIVLEGITISDESKYLLINKLTTNSKMTLSGVRTGGGKNFSNNDMSLSESKYAAGTTAASSLIGDVSGNGIQISFDRIKLDSRISEGSPTDLSAQYGTTKSIFSGATLLNKFEVDNNSTGVYNFEESEDWNESTHNVNVTYGKEIKTSVEYSGKQKKYYDQNSFVSPVNQPSTLNDVYPFNDGFLPYVKSSTADGISTTRELKVNVHVDGLTEGCGTYNHPYEITDGTQFVNVATAINKTGYPDNLRLPKIQGSNYATAISTHWCNNLTACAEFEHGTGSYTYTEGNTTYTWTDDQVSLYLASAYYLVKKDITITGSYFGLGATPASDTTGKYAFRGVIVGASSDGSVKISMSVPKARGISDNANFENTSGLITMSNGCVVKNLTIEVTPYSTDNYNYQSNGNQPYGYNENFPNYGAVINKIMGGDNIIDNVCVNYTGNFKVKNASDFKATVGGYVGCVVNGGLIFRNVDDDSLTNFVVKKVDNSGTVQSVTCNGKTINSLTDEDDLIHIHVNPFVGRVINGYAIRETDSYGFSEDGKTYGDGEARANAVEVTMHNTRKNYSIPDIDKTKNFTDAPSSVLTFTKPTGETSYNTITVPNSQALYIMSIIAQSGSGCASSDDGDYANNISYCGNKYRNYSSATSGNNNAIDNNKATHWASYDSVGNDTKGDDYNLSKSDTVNSKKAVPYIIYKYTSSYDNGTKYPARTLTKNTFYVNLVGGTTYYLPDSFRGIGFLGSNTLDDNMKIYGFNGNGTSENPTVIDLNAEYYLNQKGDDPYFGSNINNEYMIGIGLFNNLKQSSSTGFDRKYERDSKYQITNFTLQGYLSAHHVSSSGADQNANPGGDRDKVSMNTAGLIPTVLDKDITLFNFSNIDFKKIHINSYAYAGGFVAYTNSSGVMIYINNCNADGFRIDGSGRIAGFVGSYDTNTNSNSGLHINTGIDSSGKDSFSSVMRNTIINNKLSTDVKHNYTAGILGCVYSAENNTNLPADNGDNARGHLILRNVTIEGGNAETNYIGNKNNPSGSSGGILGGGSGRVNGCLIQNCVVKNIDIYGKYAGGIMGEDANRNSTMGSKTGVRIVGCTVTGQLDSDNIPQYTIMGLYYAGGVYGDTRDTNTTIHPKYKSVSANDSDYVEYKTDIDGVYIYGYNIFSANTDNEDRAFSTDNNNLKICVAAGGIIGSNNENRTIQNCKVEKCIIDVGTKASSATNTPSGGLIGRMNSGTLYGYNIEVKDCDFLTHQWSNGAATNTQKAYTYTDEDEVVHNPISGMKCGNFIGNGNSKTVTLTAVHSENNPAEVDFNSINTSASFIVYADYLDAASDEDNGTEMSTLSVLPSGYTNVKEGGLKDYFPHVNVSPVIDMGQNSIITGDGAALYQKGNASEPNTPIIDAIVNDADSNYTTVLNATKTYIQRALSTDSTDGEPNKISTYKNEMGSLPDGVEDFTVLVINSENRDYSTALINNYIQAVSNTNQTFMTDSNRTNKYTINVYPCTFNGTDYVINQNGKTPGLYVVNNDGNYKYYMLNTHADSNQSDFQFSLMDVQFYNPSNPSKEVAYHLYIPVLTKKMLMFEFYSASLSGTDNKDENFTEFGNTLAESTEAWYTAYLQFRYNQTELQSILESGAGLNWNGAKTVLFKYQTNTENSKLTNDTQFVICDPNNGDKYYYATLGDFRNDPDDSVDTDTISFASFNSKLDGSGSDFSPSTLNEMLLAQDFEINAVTSSVASENIYAVTNNLSEADVIASDGTMYKKSDSDGITKYKLVISYPSEDNPGENDDKKELIENYYLAVRAKGDSVYNYSVRSPVTTSGGVNKPTLRRSNADEGNVTNLIMGSLYTQNVTIEVLNNGTTSKEINGADHRLDVTLTSTIQLNGSSGDKDFILGHLSNPNIHLYHSFIMYLTAYDTTGERSDILGSPEVVTDFSLSGNGKNIQYNNVKLPEEEIDKTYIKLQYYDIKNYLSKEKPAMITANTQINFEEEWQYVAEFPLQDGTQDNIGVNVSAKSNLSYNPSKVQYTNMTDNPSTPSSRYFYIKESDKAALVYNIKSDILDEYDKVGMQSFNYSQQGINPRSFIDSTQTRLPIQSAATYDAVNIKRSDFVRAEKITFKMKLYKKTDVNDQVRYIEVDDVAEYIDLTNSNSVFITVNSGVKAAYTSGSKMTKEGNNLLTYTAEIDQSAITGKDNQRFTADIDFIVKTGEATTEYANYKFILEVDLLDEDDEPITQSSSASDWVVYTNAKINPDILSLSEYNAG